MLKLRGIIVLLISLFLFSCSYPVYTRSKPYIIYKEKETVEETVVSEPDQTIEEEILSADETAHSIKEADIADVKERKSIRIDAADENGKQNNEQENMDQAISILNQSQNLWEKGELDNALELLDEAYTLILDVDGDPDISWQKDDLRFMIAKRIMEIYASRSSVATGQQSEIPYVMNEDVEKEIKRFQKGDRNFFIGSYKRSGKYRPMIVKQLKEAGLPEELSWLPLVESGFKIKALSRARALGLWQFIPSTGYKFGLKRDHYVDERMDVEKSTEAAIAYLKELHGIFGDWLTVLAAYNCGEGRVLRVISRQHMNYLDNFWDLYRQLPYETARYVPRFLAASHIIKNPEKYGMDLNVALDEEIPFETVKTKKRMNLGNIARSISVSKEDMYSLNSELRFKTTPEKEYELKVPAGKAGKFYSVLAKIPTSKRPGGPVYVRHKIRKGESLSVIARKYRTSVRAIVAANRLSSKHRIRAGKWLKIPTRSSGYSGPKTYASAQRAVTKGETVKYRVKKGDSLWLLARRFNTTVSIIKRVNGLRSNRLQIGQVLKIGEGTTKTTKKAASSSSKTYTVRKGDSLYLIARRNGIKLEKLLELNRMTKSSTIYPGQTIRLQ
jgi:membrane-bound lytic murein transglycosylase D